MELFNPQELTYFYAPIELDHFNTQLLKNKNVVTFFDTHYGFTLSARAESRRIIAIINPSAEDATFLTLSNLEIHSVNEGVCNTPYIKSHAIFAVAYALYIGADLPIFANEYEIINISKTIKIFIEHIIPCK